MAGIRGPGAFFFQCQSGVCLHPSDQPRYQNNLKNPKRRLYTPIDQHFTRNVAITRVFDIVCLFDDVVVVVFVGEGS